ncbi:specifically androgen-regulated gene protein [Gastrophryne carolinensis]
MLEKEFCARNVGMEPLNSVGSVGSCDSMESLSSNHSALSGYDHLSAEELECLMFLEKTIDSLDNEDDSGLSNDELDTTEKTIGLSEQDEIPRFAASENASPKVTERTVPESKEWNDVAFEFSTNSQGYHSFPRMVQALKEQTSTKHPSGSILSDPKEDQMKLRPEKPKSMSSINQQNTDDFLTSEFQIIPPPKAFRDPLILDKRRSVTDPTDARELKLDRTIFKPARISEVPQREFMPDDLIKTQETQSYPVDKQLQFKQGPPTAPKPRALPPHIIIKTSKGGVPNLDPQQRPRTFSAHERGTDKTNESGVLKVPYLKEQERMRIEALKKLGLDELSCKQENNSDEQCRMNIHSVPAGSKQKKTDTMRIVDAINQQDGSKQKQPEDIKKGEVINQQDKSDSLRIVLAHSTTQGSVDNVKMDGLSKNRLSIKVDSLGKPEATVSGTSLMIQKDYNISSDASIAGPKCNLFGRNRPSMKKNPEQNMEEKVTSFGKPSNEADGISHIPSNVKSEDDLFKESSSGRDHFQNHMRNISKSPENTKTNALPLKASFTVQEMSSLPDKTFEILSDLGHCQVSNSQGISSENTSAGSTLSFPRPKESASQSSPEVIRQDEKKGSVANKKNRHSTHFETPSDQGLRLPQGSVPGLRQINIKSSTLERSGIGLSGSLPSFDKEAQKGGNLFFRKPLFSGNFLRNNRPRPLSLGTGKDFAGLESPSTDAVTTEKHSFFSRSSRPSAPVTSVKITPKGSTDEHRREALKKLGILKE